MPDAADLVAHARETRVVVIGGAGAVAALECAKVGMAVTLLSDIPTETPTDRVDLGGVTVGIDVDGFDRTAPEAAALIDELGHGGGLEPLAPVATWLAGLPGDAPGTAAPLPGDAILGIPANPWDPAVRRVIGWAGTWRAYLDRVRPPLTIGRERNLDALVRSRMGDRVAERLVAPVTRARFGLEPSQVDVEVAAPGLNTSLTRTGSLAGAVSALNGAAGDDTSAPRAVAVGDPDAWDAALSDRLRDLAVDVRRGLRVRALRATDAAWELDIDGGDADGAVVEGDAAAPAFTADIVIVAASDEPTARSLLRGVADLPGPAATPGEDVVLLRVRLADPGRGEVVPLTGDVRRIVDLVALRPSLAESIDVGERIVHVTLAATDADDEAVIDAARDAASAAFGVPLSPTDVVAAGRVRVAGTIPRVRLGAEADSEAVRQAIASVPGLALTGPWLVGGGRAEAVADAVAEAARVRRRVLWGGADGIGA